MKRFDYGLKILGFDNVHFSLKNKQMHQPSSLFGVLVRWFHIAITSHRTLEVLCAREAVNYGQEEQQQPSAKATRGSSTTSSTTTPQPAHQARTHG